MLKFLSTANNQKGAIPLLLIVGIIGILGVMAIANMAPFKNNFLASLYPKDQSFAAVSGPISGPVSPPPSQSPSVAPSPSLLPSPSVIPSPIPATQTIDFNTKAVGHLNGQYPTGVINWGTNKWYVSAPWKSFTTRSISFQNASIKSADFTFITPKKLLSMEAFNGGVASTITVACAGNPTVTKAIAANTKLTLVTNWTKTCTTVTIQSTNSWDTNFDNLVIQ